MSSTCSLIRNTAEKCTKITGMMKILCSKDENCEILKWNKRPMGHSVHLSCVPFTIFLNEWLRLWFSERISLYVSSNLSFLFHCHTFGNRCKCHKAQQMRPSKLRIHVTVYVPFFRTVTAQWPLAPTCSTV